MWLSQVFQRFPDFLIKVRINLLRRVKQRIFIFGLFLCLSRRNLAFVRKNLIAAECQEFIDAGSELLHIESVFALYKIFDIVEIACHSAFQLPDFLFLKVVLCNAYI